MTNATPAIAAFRLFLATLTASQRSALLDVLCSHVENVQVDCEEAPSEFAFIVDLSEAIASVSISAACDGMWTLSTPSSYSDG